MTQPSDFDHPSAVAAVTGRHDPAGAVTARLGWKRAAVVAALGVVAAVIAVGAGAAPAVAGAAGNVPLIPATTDAPSPFKADPASSLPTGLVPNQTVTPIVAPQNPVVLAWSPVPGAVSYTVEIAGSPGFQKILWETQTDQPQVAPDKVLPDGTYWWRVTAVDTAGTQGITSAPATFAKKWVGTVTGGILSATPGGPQGSLVLTTPYLRWDPVPGAAHYQVQVAAADQFASPAFDSGLITDTAVTPGDAGVLPDDVYAWRVRAFDPIGTPGPWTVEPHFTKQWVQATPTSPANGASVTNFALQWNPVAGADSYQVQVTNEQNTFTGKPLVVDAATSSTAYVPNLDEYLQENLGPGQYWWRVRPVAHGVTGGWSPMETFTYADPSGLAAPTTLSSDTTASTTALMPIFSWTPVSGAHVYRIDIATDSLFHNIVFSELTPYDSWGLRQQLPDNQEVTGYYWRVVWGSTPSKDNPGFMVYDDQVPTAQFSKQTQVTPGTAASGVLSSPPLFSWNDILGASNYQLQVSRDSQFADGSTASMTVYGLGTNWNPPGQANPLTSGTWYWRVRPNDTPGNSLTFSPISSFVINPPAPAPSGPPDGATVIASPELSWQPVNGACSYDVQVSSTTTFPDAGGGGGGSGPVSSGANTAQTAWVPTGSRVTHAGTWYWRVRAELCNSDTGAWSNTQSFNSELPPQFNLNHVPTAVSYNSHITVAGQLVVNGSAVSHPLLTLLRRLYPSNTYAPIGVVQADDSGHFSFGLTMTRSADYQLRWAKDNLPYDQGIASFNVAVSPRVSFTLTRSRVVRGRVYGVQGFVYPIRPAWIQYLAASGWTNITRIPATSRFRFNMRANFTTGGKRLRLYSPTDALHMLVPTGSRSRSLFVYDVIVIRK